MAIEWRKSKRSTGTGNCVEVAAQDSLVLFRDSKLGEESPVIAITRKQASQFKKGLV